MPITLSTPITVVINDIGDKFFVEKTTFDFNASKVEFFWRIKTRAGKILKQGIEELEGEEFVTFYNTEYKTHANLVNKVSELAGYSGEFTQETLI